MSQIRNFLTIDVEDYYHVSAFKDVIRFEDWPNYESRVVRNTRKILDILCNADTKATFFILGWVAERYPEIVKEIDSLGHEIACHSYKHKCVFNMSRDEFRDDLKKAKAILENITGKAVNGYRAPSYSITIKSLWALDIIGEAGFKYDSSIFPIYHDTYGIPDAPRFRYQLPKYEMWEYPISTAMIMGQKLPLSGGGYFRLFPFSITKMGLAKINESEHQPFMFYIHPWELDVQQPRIKKTSLLSNFRHYQNLDKTEERFKKLLEIFSFGPIG